MERILKFRAWYNIDGGWAPVIEVGSILYECVVNGNGTDVKDNFSIEQFTGILDKNGKEIYEGDIINCKWLAELGITEVDCEANGVAQFNVDRGGYEVNFGKVTRFWGNADGSYEVENIELFQSDEDMVISFEVIGNVHETAHLIKN